MKYILLLIFTFTFYTNVSAQHLSLDDLINIRSKDVESANNYLSPKGWEFSDSEEETHEYYSLTSWCYGRTPYSSRAKAFVYLSIGSGYSNKVTYTTISKSAFDAIKSKVHFYKMIKTSSIPENGQITTSYSGANYVVTMSISKDEFTYRPIYKVILLKRQKVVNQIYNTTVDDSNELTNDNHTTTFKSPELIDSYIKYFKSLVTGKKDTQSPEKLAIYSIVTPHSLKLLDSPNNIAKIIIVIPSKSKLFIMSELPNIKNIEDRYMLVCSNEYYGYIKYTDLQ